MKNKNEIQMEDADKITNIENELIEIKRSQTILQGIDAAKNQKAEAKKSYQDFLDQGDERGMTHSLSSIRETNEKIKNLKGQLVILYQNIQKLLVRTNELKTVIKQSNLNLVKTFMEKLELEKTKHNDNWEQIRKLSEEIEGYCHTIQKHYLQPALPDEGWKKEYAESADLQREYHSEAGYIAHKKAENI